MQFNQHLKSQISGATFGKIRGKIQGKLPAGKMILIAALVSAGFSVMPLRADEADTVSKLISQSQFDQALARADAFLANRPNDPQMRFLKGLILTEKNKTGEAITVFTKLTEDYPELPEPYNNLAVLYAGKGDYEKARESLEMAIRTHPSYATAYENLGDVYAKLASQSYDKALQLDGKNAGAQTKLSMVRNLIAGKPEPLPTEVASAKSAKPTTPTAKATAPANTQVAAVAPAPASAPVAAPAAPTAPSTPTAQIKPTAPVASAAVQAAAVAPAVISAVTPSASKPQITATTPAPAEANKPNVIGADSQVLDAVERWAKAWSNQDIKGYLGSYSKSFDPPGRMSRDTWEKQREERIVGKESIRVVVENPLITISGDEAVVKFRQGYYSNRLNNVSNKTLVLKAESGSWKIVGERVGG